MTIRSIEIDGHAGTITIARTDAGALVTAGNQVAFEMRRDEPRDARWARACHAAELVYGRDRKGRCAATNSMIHEVWTELDRVAGC
ncbi:MAG: hypothetical protein KF699_10635 [Phycisphaeraceae bacterium]|nr:hypothetical protein [Phycisphaeraceae bacterium]